jgi:hypothetical protein
MTYKRKKPKIKAVKRKQVFRQTREKQEDTAIQPIERLNFIWSRFDQDNFRYVAYALVLLCLNKQDELEKDLLEKTQEISNPFLEMDLWEATLMFTKAALPIDVLTKEGFTKLTNYIYIDEFLKDIIDAYNSGKTITVYGDMGIIIS